MEGGLDKKLNTKPHLVFVDHCPLQTYLLPLQGYEVGTFKYKTSYLPGKSHHQHKFILSHARFLKPFFFLFNFISV